MKKIILAAGRDPVLFCDGCYAVVSELQKDMVASKVSGDQNKSPTFYF